MSHRPHPSANGSKIRDLAITAAVASVVSALVAPWIRRWMDGPMDRGQVPQPPSEHTAITPEEFDARIGRLLAVPNPLAEKAMHSSHTATPATRRKTSDVEDDEQ